MRWLKCLVVFLFITGILICIYFIASKEMSGRENSLMTIILTMFSILATWLVGHMYSQSQHRKAIQEVQEFERNNLQTYAKKAAEKVNNLSNELQRLSVYLAEELESSETDDVKESLLSREERIASAVHIVNTLKSVNDTALSDWEGVIGDLLEQQREEKEEKEEELRGTVEQLQDLLVAGFDQRYGDYYEQGRMQEQINMIRRDLRYIAMNLGITRIPMRKRVRESKRDVQLSCPNCGESLVYRQRPNVKGYKSVICRYCDKKFISRYSSDEGFILDQRRVASETIECPNCKSKFEIELDTMPTSSKEVQCEACDNLIRVSRTIKGDISVKVKKKKPSSEKSQTQLNEEIIEQVKENLPPQPWPKGVHYTVAEQIHVEPRLVAKAINELMKRGDVLLQINGTVYIPRDEKNQR